MYIPFELRVLVRTRTSCNEDCFSTCCSDLKKGHLLYHQIIGQSGYVKITTEIVLYKYLVLLLDVGIQPKDVDPVFPFDVTPY